MRRREQGKYNSLLYETFPGKNLTTWRDAIIIHAGGVVVERECNAVVNVVVVILDDEGSPLVSMWDAAAAAWLRIIPMFYPRNKLYINMN